LNLKCYLFYKLKIRLNFIYDYNLNKILFKISYYENITVNEIEFSIKIIELKLNYL